MEKILHLLDAGQLILAPTDTIWGILCDATNPDAVNKVYDLKKRPDSKAMVCMVSDESMLKKYISEIPDDLHNYIQDSRPTTVIYNAPTGIAHNAVAQENTVAIRIVNHHFCTPLIRAFGKPLISTSANLSGEKHPTTFSDIVKEIVAGVDHVVKLDSIESSALPSRIIKIKTNGEISLLRP